MVSLQRHGGGVDGIGAGLDVATGGDILGRLVVITTTTFIHIGRFRH